MYGISIHIYHENQPNVGMPYMDPMGLIQVRRIFNCKSSLNLGPFVRLKDRTFSEDLAGAWKGMI